jgi:hypothetical protein
MERHTPTQGEINMTLNIIRDKITVMTVSNMDEARAYVESIANAPKVRGEMFFDIDADDAACADAVIFTRTGVKNYAIEPA